MLILLATKRSTTAEVARSIITTCSAVIAGPRSPCVLSAGGGSCMLGELPVDGGAIAGVVTGRATREMRCSGGQRRHGAWRQAHYLHFGNKAPIRDADQWEGRLLVAKHSPKRSYRRHDRTLFLHQTVILKTTLVLHGCSSHVLSSIRNRQL